MRNVERAKYGSGPAEFRNSQTLSTPCAALFHLLGNSTRPKYRNKNGHSNERPFLFSSDLVLGLLVSRRRRRLSGWFHRGLTFDFCARCCLTGACRRAAGISSGGSGWVFRRRRGTGRRRRVGRVSRRRCRACITGFSRRRRRLRLFLLMLIVRLRVRYHGNGCKRGDNGKRSGVVEEFHWKALLLWSSSVQCGSIVG